MKSRKLTIPSFSVIVIFIAMALLGCAFSTRLPVKLSPSEALPSLTVSFSMTGSARTVESEVTNRLESMLARIQGIKSIKSRSSNGSGSVTIGFDRSADMELARFEAAMIVRQLWGSMPESASYPVISLQQIDRDAARPFMSYTINADEPPSQILMYAEDYIKPELARIPGVAKVEFSGATPKEWQLTYDSDILQTLGLEMSELQKAISTRGNREFLTPGITLGISDQSDTLNLEEIIVADKEGRIVTLDNLATARHVDAEPRGYYRINGLNSLYMNITSTDDANQIILSEEIRGTLERLRESMPKGFLLDLNYDASDRINKELDNIYMRTGLTVLILLLFVGIITLNFRYLLMVAISLAINIAIAFAFYYMTGVEIQLYSLAGITISLNLIIDNIIVMTEHITRRHNLKAFTAVLAATLTTVGALSIIFFLDEKTMLGLKDFVKVVLINLIVSLFVALFLVPALIERMGVKAKKWSLKRQQSITQYTVPVGLNPDSKFTKLEFSVLNFLCQYKGWVYAVFILGFGLPVFLLPDKIEGEGRWADIYNSTLGSQTYKEKIKPWTDVVLGGTLRLFAQKVYNGNYYNRSVDEPVLSVNATLPNGATLSQMNELIKKMEVYLAGEEGIRQFHTNVFGPRRAGITIYFKPEAQRTGYPYRLKSDVISKALTLGGGSWSVYGLEDQGFNNDVRESAGSSRIKVTGYNYDDLMKYAEEIRDSLLTYKRIKEVTLNSEFSWWKDDFTEFYLDIDNEKLARKGLNIQKLYQAINREIGNQLSAGTVMGPNGLENIKLFSSGKDRDVWGFMKIPFRIGDNYYKLEDFATIEKRQAPQDVVKEDQEYVLCIQYEYIGSYQQAKRVLEGMVEKFNDKLPLGYKVESAEYAWQKEDTSKQYLLILLVAVIIFFISAILFNSLRQPLAIIFVIPVSFIGVFLTFYVFNLKFDQGGFAAFVLLCGITVNAAIYIVNEYNALRRKNPEISARECYLEAFNFKIVAVLLTVLSTVLGFIPFLIGDSQLSFWFPLAAGTMGGLLFSLIAIFTLLPTLILNKK